MFRYTAGDQWHLLDTTRAPDNPATSKVLFANTNGADTDYTAYPIDILSNGFKIKASAPFCNESGGNYVYMAFAEYPFKNGNAAIYNIN
jgi:hypothetical protein